jgi:xylulokinase
MIAKPGWKIANKSSIEWGGKMVGVEDKYVLVIDLGTSGPKVGLADRRGEILGWEFEPTPMYTLPGGGCEQNPDEWWAAILQATGRLLGRSLAPADSIAALVCTSQWSGTVPVDHGGRPLMNAIIWLDSRGAPYVREISRGFVTVGGFDPLKLLTWIRLSGMPPETSGKGPTGHILYLKREQPEIYRRAHLFLEPKDYINLRLTGVAATTFDTIALHSLTDNRDIHNVRYDPRLFRLAGFERERFPELRSAVDVLGTLTAQAAAELGLPAQIQVVAGTPDIPATAIGSGAVLDFQPHLYVGTSSWISCHVPFKKLDVQHAIVSLPSAIPGRYLMIDEQEWAAGCLNYILDNVFSSADELSPEGNTGDAHEHLNSLAEGSPAGSRRVIFTPWLYGERTPVQDAWVRAGFFNVSLENTRADLARSVFEGVALNTRWLLGAAEHFCKRLLDGIHVVGGGVVSSLWCQIFADVLDRTIHQMKEPQQATMRGAAILALVALGETTFDQVASAIQIERTYRPDPQNREIYDELYREFINLFKALQPIYKRLNSKKFT